MKLGDIWKKNRNFITNSLSVTFFSFFEIKKNLKTTSYIWVVLKQWNALAISLLMNIKELIILQCGLKIVYVHFNKSMKSLTLYPL